MCVYVLQADMLSVWVGGCCRLTRAIRNLKLIDWQLCPRLLVAYMSSSPSPPPRLFDAFPCKLMLTKLLDVLTSSVRSSIWLRC